MKTIRSLFDYQKFAKNKNLQKKIDDVYDRYLAGVTELPDDALDVSAAGEVDALTAKRLKEKKNGPSSV